ncbi:MAG: carbon storage regulator CsrA [Bacillota bacterium]
MLVLARKKGQSVIIGKDIKILVVEVTGETVRLGIEAPPELEIFRTEIYQQLKEENAGSVTSPEDAIRLLEKKDR